MVKSGLPQIGRMNNNDGNNNNNNEKLQSFKTSGESVGLLAKDGKIADEYLKRLKDTKQYSSVQNIKVFTKERYTLDMYKVKDHIASRIIKPPPAADTLTLPALMRIVDKSNTSLHN